MNNWFVVSWIRWLMLQPIEVKWSFLPINVANNTRLVISPRFLTSTQDELLELTLCLSCFHHSHKVHDLDLFSGVIFYPSRVTTRQKVYLSKYGKGQKKQHTSIICRDINLSQRSDSVPDRRTDIVIREHTLMANCVANSKIRPWFLALLFEVLENIQAFALLEVIVIIIVSRRWRVILNSVRGVKCVYKSPLNLKWQT